jgi:hypothetical protein
MKYLKYVALLGILLLGIAGSANAQVRVGVGVGPVGIGVGVGSAPACAYGYYGYYPYACAPYGYYGPSYFSGGVFIGAGPWYHGFYGRPGFGYGYRPGFGYRPGYGYRAPVHAFAGNTYHGSVGTYRGASTFHGNAGFHGGHR